MVGKKNIIALLLMVSCLLFYSGMGCNAAVKDATKSAGKDSNKVYQNMGGDDFFFNTIENATNGSGTVGTTLYDFYCVVKYVAPYIIIFSFLFGVIIVVLCRKNKGLRRFGLLGLMLGIPLSCIIGVLGFGYFCSMFYS